MHERLSLVYKEKREGGEGGGTAAAAAILPVKGEVNISGPSKCNKLYPIFLSEENK